MREARQHTTNKEVVETHLHEKLQDVHHRFVEVHPQSRNEPTSNWQLVLLIIEIGGILLTAMDDLSAAITNLQGQVSAENTELATIVSSLQTVQQQLTDLQGQINAGGAVTADQIEAVATQVTDVANSAAAAVAAAQAATAPPAPPAPPAGQ